MYPGASYPIIKGIDLRYYFEEKQYVKKNLDENNINGFNEESLKSILKQVKKIDRQRLFHIHSGLGPANNNFGLDLDTEKDFQEGENILINAIKNQNTQIKK